MCQHHTGLAPEAMIYSARVLGANLRGKGSVFLAGVRWALDHDWIVVNRSPWATGPYMFND